MVDEHTTSESNETGPYLLEFFYWRTRDGRKLYTRWTRRANDPKIQSRSCAAKVRLAYPSWGREDGESIRHAMQPLLWPSRPSKRRDL